MSLDIFDLAILTYCMRSEIDQQRKFVDSA